VRPVVLGDHHGRLQGSILIATDILLELGGGNFHLSIISVLDKEVSGRFFEKKLRKKRSL